MNMITPLPIDLSLRVSQYVKLRDKIKEIKDRHKTELQPYEAALEQLNSLLLDHLNTINTDSTNIRGVGTVYRTIKKSASLSDAAAFRRYVVGGEHWDLIDWKANVSAVEGFIAENQAPPPGVNFNSRMEVGVRRG